MVFMKLIQLDEVDSTHVYLKNLIKTEGFFFPVAVYTTLQTNGIGSRGNSWQGKRGNLFFSFVIEKKDLPEDLELQSASIYFSYILKELLKSLGSQLWLKWPNDFYMENKKIGGTITTVTKDLIYCGIGINLIEVDKEFGKLDIKIDIKATLENYFKKLKNNQSWKEIFNSFKVEFQKSKNFQATIENKKISLENAILNYDGSVQLQGKKVYSLR
jgi:BirA family transcriptional regulator, biotin operon repressor / biotin---[acetyl-CoA-carboxylase] ligase